MTRSISAAIFVSLMVFAAHGQEDLVKTEGVTGPLHQSNIGKIVFTSRTDATQELTENDLLKSLELNGSNALALRAYLGTSLTNYLHRLSPGLSAEELTSKGNYQISYYVDGALVHKEQLPPPWVKAENKNTKTVYTAVLLAPSNPDSPWGAVWHIFMLNGGAEALTRGRHLFRLELRPYLQIQEMKVGDVIAAGELTLNIPDQHVDERALSPAAIAPGSGWLVSGDNYDRGKIRELKRQIAAGVYKDIHSIVVVKNGKLLIEEYFNGTERSTLQNTRSVGKSFTSTMMGIAIRDGYIKGVDQKLKDFYDLQHFANFSPAKEQVTLKSLLTMSSGFDANDDDPDSPGNEVNMYPTDNWVKFALDLPMDRKTTVGQKWRYFTAGMIVLGDILNRSVPGGLENYSARKLFRPLGINNYAWDHTPQKVVNTAGGLQMSALDFAKYGQLYKDRGRWHGRQIVPAAWVDKTFTRYQKVPYGPTLNYGYLFWNMTYTVGGRPYETYFATGNGGNKIFVFKDQPLVIVITATAFGKWYMHRQVDSMMERYILPAVLR